jgi:hypothetical protein
LNMREMGDSIELAQSCSYICQDRQARWWRERIDALYGLSFPSCLDLAESLLKFLCLRDKGRVWLVRANRRTKFNQLLNERLEVRI